MINTTSDFNSMVEYLHSIGESKAAKSAVYLLNNAHNMELGRKDVANIILNAVNKGEFNKIVHTAVKYGYYAV